LNVVIADKKHIFALGSCSLNYDNKKNEKKNNATDLTTIKQK